MYAVSSKQHKATQSRNQGSKQHSKHNTRHSKQHNQSIRNTLLNRLFPNRPPTSTYPDSPCTTATYTASLVSYLLVSFNYENIINLKNTEGEQSEIDLQLLANFIRKSALKKITMYDDTIGRATQGRLGRDKTFACCTVAWVLSALRFIQLMARALVDRVRTGLVYHALMQIYHILQVVFS